MSIDINDINPGDTVTVKFDTEIAGKFSVTGIVRELNERLYVASWCFGSEHEAETRGFVEVTDHLIAEPPFGYVGFDEGYQKYWIHLPEGWFELSSERGYSNGPYDWSDVARRSTHLTEVTA